MDQLFNNPVTAAIIQFLNEIGLAVRAQTFDEKTFLPGIKIDQGTILIDPAKLKYPGDLLHDAGHLAIKTEKERRQSGTDAGQDAAEEMMAIAWSYAALSHLQLPLEVVFHPDGYRGDSPSLIENFGQGRYFGVPMLQWLGMTTDEKQAKKRGIAPYPHMINWLRPGNGLEESKALPPEGEDGDLRTN
jgi:hypothetical protein